LGLDDELTYLENEKGEGISAGFLTYATNSDYPDIEQLVKDTDEVIIKMKETGRYDEIYSKYLLD
jgi:ABC-type amino acid transport substrate-binding protein